MLASVCAPVCGFMLAHCRCRWMFWCVHVFIIGSCMGGRHCFYYLFSRYLNGDWNSHRHIRPLETPSLCCCQCWWLWLAEITANPALGVLLSCPCSSSPQPPCKSMMWWIPAPKFVLCAGGCFWVLGLFYILGRAYWCTGIAYLVHHCDQCS